MCAEEAQANSPTQLPTHPPPETGADPLRGFTGLIGDAILRKSESRTVELLHENSTPPTHLPQHYTPPRNTLKKQQCLNQFLRDIFKSIGVSELCEFRWPNTSPGPLEFTKTPLPGIPFGADKKQENFKICGLFWSLRTITKSRCPSGGQAARLCDRCALPRRATSTCLRQVEAWVPHAGGGIQSLPLLHPPLALLCSSFPFLHMFPFPFFCSAPSPLFCTNPSPLF